MKIGLLLLSFSLIILTAYKKFVRTNNGEILGTSRITYMTYSRPEEAENKQEFILRPDTLVAYSKNQKILYKFNVFFESSNGKTAILHQYFFFGQNKDKCLYYSEMHKEEGYKILNKDSVMKEIYSVGIGRPTDTSFALPALRNSKRIYNDTGFVVKEIVTSPSRCINKYDTIVYWYATDKIWRPILLAPYIDSIRNQTVIRYTMSMCVPDTATQKGFYRIKANGELQTLGVIHKGNSIYKVFNEMEKQFNKRIK